MEAFACGIPVVVPRTQGFNDTVQHQVDGFLFNPGDSNDARRYIQLLKDDKKLRLELGESGRQSVKDRSINRVVLDLIQWYHTGIALRKSRNPITVTLSFLLVAFLVPVTIFMFVIYDILVSPSVSLFFACPYLIFIFE